MLIKRKGALLGESEVGALDSRTSSDGERDVLDFNDLGEILLNLVDYLIEFGELIGLICTQCKYL